MMLTCMYPISRKRMVGHMSVPKQDLKKGWTVRLKYSYQKRTFEFGNDTPTKRERRGNIIVRLFEGIHAWCTYSTHPIY
jgi:hypothetical protein